MKRIVLLLAAVSLASVNCFAQNDGKARSLKDNIAKSDVAIQNAKKSVNPKTWMDRGELFRDAYGVNINFLRLGMAGTEAKLYFKEPKEVLTVEDNGVLKETYVYSQIKLNFEDGKLRTWEETESVAQNPLSESVKAYQKASSLDEKGKNTKKIEDAYRAISSDLENKAFNEFYLEKYKEAYNSALQRIEVSKLLDVTDTMFYYYAGYFAYSNEMWSETADNINKLISLGYEETGSGRGAIYVWLSKSYASLGDSVKSLSTAQAGFTKYPDNLELVYDLINQYLKRNQTQEALSYIEKAKVSDPQNATLLFAEGTLQDKLGDQNKALAAYDASIAIDPKFYSPYYNKGVIYYNKALNLMDEANMERDNTKYEMKKKEADGEFIKSLQSMEKAYELNPSERDIMETLKNIYYRLKADPEMEKKYNDMVQKLG